MKYLKLLIMILLLHTAAYGQDSLNCRLLTTCELANAYALEVVDNYVFTGAQKFSILNISDVYDPILVYNDTLSNDYINSIFIDGSYGYIGVYYGFIILDLSTLESPVVLSHLVLNEVIEDVLVDNNIAYLGTSNNALLVMDVTDPMNPFQIGRVDQNISDVWGLDIYDNFLFAAAADTGVIVFDISVPSTPIELATLNLPYGDGAFDVKFKDNILYCLSTLTTFDISDINNPQLLDFLEETSGYAIEIEGNYAYCTSNSELSVVDISNPADLNVVGYYPLPYVGPDVFVNNKVAYVPCQNDGVYFIQFDETTFIQEVNSNVNDFILSQNYPNPFNPNTLINYSIPKADFVVIKVYDILGNEISTLLNEYREAGSYKVKFDGNGISSGMYYYRIISGDYSDTKKMSLLK
jgi:hypothetical protein